MCKSCSGRGARVLWDLLCWSSGSLRGVSGQGGPSRPVAGRADPGVRWWRCGLEGFVPMADLGVPEGQGPTAPARLLRQHPSLLPLFLELVEVALPRPPLVGLNGDQNTFCTARVLLKCRIGVSLMGGGSGGRAPFIHGSRGRLDAIIGCLAHP
ncbi:hypothetical protein L7F22_060655 [Adiantum nelumboides]|nr:hypothetical protein [Adiantum nelumboides]